MTGLGTLHCSRGVFSNAVSRRYSRLNESDVPEEARVQIAIQDILKGQAVGPAHDTRLAVNEVDIVSRLKASGYRLLQQIVIAFEWISLVRLPVEMGKDSSVNLPFDPPHEKALTQPGKERLSSGFHMLLLLCLAVRADSHSV